MFDTLIPAIAEAVFGALTEASDLSDWLRHRLARDPEKLAFRLALTQTLIDLAPSYPARTLQSFAESLCESGAAILARTLQPASPFPTADALTDSWLNHLNATSVIHTHAEFTAFAQRLLDRLGLHLASQQPLQWISQARTQQGSEEAIRRMAETAETDTSTLTALRAEVATSLERLKILLNPSKISIASEGAELHNSTISIGSIAGRDQITINHYFTAGLPRLVVDYSSRIQEFLGEYLGTRRKRVPFGGRSAQLAELDAWLDDPNPAVPPYYLMSAEAGRGKSALVCRWLVRLTTRPDLALIFLPISIRFETATQDVVFAALAARLAAVFGEEMKAAALSAEEWKGVCQSYLRRSLPDGKRLLVILDGLDEAADWTAGRNLFPGDPPDTLRVLVTARLRPGEVNAQGWATTLGWQSPQLARTATLPPLDRRGVEEALASMGNPLDQLATQVDVVGELHRLSEGDPLLVRLYVDELLNQGERVKQLKAEELGTIQPGLAGYFERWWQDQQEQWRRQQRDPIRQEQSLRLLLNAIAAALGPLTHDDLAALHPDLGDGLLLKRLTQDVSRWLVGDGKGQGYSYSHPRLGYFFWELLNHKEQAEWDRRFCTWGAETLAVLNDGTLDSKAAPVYLLRHYANHLERSHAPAEAFYALVSNGWRLAWEWVDISLGGFLGDVDRAWEKAKLGYDPNKPGKAVALVQQIKAALCKASVAAIGNNMPPELLAQAVQVGLRTPVQALAMAKLVLTDQHQPAILMALLPSLPTALLGEALIAARSIQNKYSRANTLSCLAAYLPPEERQTALSEALTAACSIQDEPFRAIALCYLAAHLPLGQRLTVVDEVLTAARSIQNESLRADALSSLVAHLTLERRPTVVDEALTAARSIQNESLRADALSSLAAHLTLERRPTVVDEALTAARSIQNKSHRADALSSLAAHLPSDQRPTVVSEALTDIRSIQNESHRADALSNLAAHLPPAVLGEALTTARSIQDEYFRTGVLSNLAVHLPSASLGEALTAIRSIQDKSFRATALSSLAAYLPPSQRQTVLGEALTAARSIQDEDELARVLSSLAVHLPKKMLGTALTTARSIQRESDRARALRSLTTLLPPDQYQTVIGEELTAACALQRESDRADILRSLGQPLADWQKIAPVSAYHIWLETLPVLASRPRPEFLRDLTALMPFILSLAGDEAPQAAEGIYHAIQEVCGWWP